MREGSVTLWLARLREGEGDALNGLLPLLYDELRSLARSHLRREDTGHTLGATALVHEAYLRLAEREHLSPADRRHFFAIAAQAMRRVLIDHARARKRAKRGAGRPPLSLEEATELMTEEVADDLLAMDLALERLAQANPRAARVVEERVFGGRTLEETAGALGVSTKTVQRDWLLAHAWIRKELGRDPVNATLAPGPRLG